MYIISLSTLKLEVLQLMFLSGLRDFCYQYREEIHVFIGNQTELGSMWLEDEAELTLLGAGRHGNHLQEPQ